MLLNLIKKKQQTDGNSVLEHLEYRFFIFIWWYNKTTRLTLLSYAYFTAISHLFATSFIIQCVIRVITLTHFNRSTFFYAQNKCQTTNACTVSSLSPTKRIFRAKNFHSTSKWHSESEAIAVCRSSRERDDAFLMNLFHFTFHIISIATEIC